MIVLDTHVLIWFVQGKEVMGREARHLVRHALDRQEAIVSTISFWEVSLLADRQRIRLGRATADWVRDIGRRGVQARAISPEIAVDAGQLPGEIHGDPIDRLIVATARIEACPLLTADKAILRYAESGHVRAIDARV